jgi:1,2-diacylglycerol 3-alpha-glucosyltransferase
MRIAYLTQSYPPMISGAAISAQKTAEAMAKRGHQVLVIAASDREYPYHTYTDNLNVVRLRSFNNPLRVGQRLMLSPRHKVLKLLQKFQPDVIHPHEPLQMGWIALEYAKRAHIPVTLTTHQLPWFVASYLPRSLKPFVETTLWTYARMSLKKYTTLITPTQTTARIVEEKTGLTPNVISYGLDLQTFRPPLYSDHVSATREKLNLPSNIPIILHVGRLDTDKSVDNVIRAVRPAILKSDAHVLVVGDGCQKNHLVCLCRELDIEKRVHFTGFIPPSELPEIYRMANIFVTASEIETQGIVLLEAAASGLPIVAVNATCIPEIVHNLVNGYLIEPGDIHTFSDALTTLLNDPERACAIGEKGRMLTESHDIQNTWVLHESLYQEMIRQNRRQRVRKFQVRLAQWKVVKSLIGLK